jgi:hypothetical protein
MVEEVQRVDGPPPLAPPDEEEDGESDEAVPDEAPVEPVEPEPPLSEGGAIEILYRPGVPY